MAGNHITNNILTRGNMNISALYRGFVLPAFKFVVRRRGGGSPQYGEGIEELRRELFKTGKTYDEIDVIEVYVDWNKDVEKHGKEIYVEFIQKKIEAQLINNKKYNIKVELIEKDKD